MKLGKIATALALLSAAGVTQATTTYTVDDWNRFLSGLGSTYGPSTPFGLFYSDGVPRTTTTLGYLQSLPQENVVNFVNAMSGLINSAECGPTTFVEPSGNVLFGDHACFEKSLSYYITYLGLNIAGVGGALTSSAVAPLVSAQVQRATSIQQALIISNVLASISNTRLSSGPKRVALGQAGMAAGNQPSPWNVWLNASSSDIGNSFATTRYDGDVTNAIGGIDYSLSKELVVGLSLGRDRTKLDTRFNNGGLTSKATMVAPYVSYQISDVLSVDASLGYADGDADVRYNGSVTGNQGFTRNFAAANLNGNWWFNDLQVSGKLSYINAQEKLKQFTDSAAVTTAGTKNRVEQLRLGVQVGYWMNGVMPYVSVAAVHDLTAPTMQGVSVSTDRDAYTASIGVNFFAQKALTANISYTTEKGRANSKNDLWMASIGYRF